MTSYKRNSKLVLTVILTLALVFGLAPMLQSSDAYAAEGDFNIYVQYGATDPTTTDAPIDLEGRKLVKSYSKSELEALATNKVMGVLYKGSAWRVIATNKYIPVSTLLGNAGVVFNAKDQLAARASSDGFKTVKSYEELQAETYFYPGTTATDTNTASKEKIEAVIGLNFVGSANNENGFGGLTAAGWMGAIDWSTATDNTRFMMGVSEENYLAGNAAGNRLATGPDEITIVKDAKDAISASNVSIAKSTYIATGKQIKPTATVKIGKTSLKSGTDYTVSYGANKLGKGTVTVTAKGNYTGKVTKNFSINPRSTKITKAKAGAKKATVKWAKAKDAVTGYQLAYKSSSTKKFKTVKIKGQKKVSKVVKKLKAKKVYSFKVRTYKTASGKTYYSAYSKTVKSKKIK